MHGNCFCWVISSVWRFWSWPFWKGTTLQKWKHFKSNQNGWSVFLYNCQFDRKIILQICINFYTGLVDILVHVGLLSRFSGVYLLNLFRFWGANSPGSNLSNASRFFFTVYVKYKKNYSFSRVVFLFFSDQNCHLFLFKNNWQR